MSENKWDFLQGLARSRGYEVAVNGDRFTLAPRVKLSRHTRSSVLSQALDDRGIELASRWLQSKRKLFNPWSFL
jgi:hypothetical protein